MESHARLARSILARSGTHQVTHLKLQKLCFYSYGIVRAFGGDVGGPVEFRAWKHGPVNTSVYRDYKHYKDQPIPPPVEDSTFDATTSSLLDDVLAVYGRLTAWELRNQSHLEQPWREADATVGDVIPDAAIVGWFTRLYRRDDGIKAPDLLIGGGGLDLDGIPRATYPSFHDLAERCRRLGG